MRFVEDIQTVPELPGFLGLPISPALGTRLVESGLLALVALAAILMLGRPMIGRISAVLAPQAALAGAAAGGGSLAGPDGAEPQAAGQPGDPAQPGAAQPALTEGMVAIANIQGQLRASAINNLVQLVQHHPDESLAVLRRWLAPEGAS
jgi:flagellar M-ring protein FliF